MKYDVYGDESSQNAHHFLVIGTLLIPTDNCAEIKARLQDARNPRWRSQEMKWTKINGAVIRCYTNVIDEIFKILDSGQGHYHSIIVDATELNHRQFNAGDADLGFNKLNYQLLLKCARFHGRGNSMYVYLDQRTTVHHPKELGEIVNNGAASRWGIFNAPIKKCVHRPSKTTTLIQVADLITGAIAFHKNEWDRREGASCHKIAVANHIARKLGTTRLGNDTRFAQRHFTMWNFKLR